MKQIVRRIVQQMLLLPAAAWCRLAATDVYRPPDCPSIDDRTKLHFLSSGLSAFLLIAGSAVDTSSDEVAVIEGGITRIHRYRTRQS